MEIFKFSPVPDVEERPRNLLDLLAHAMIRGGQDLNEAREVLFGYLRDGIEAGHLDLVFYDLYDAVTHIVSGARSEMVRKALDAVNSGEEAQGPVSFINSEGDAQNVPATGALSPALDELPIYVGPGLHVVYKLMTAPQHDMVAAKYRARGDTSYRHAAVHEGASKVIREAGVTCTAEVSWYVKPDLADVEIPTDTSSLADDSVVDRAES